MEHGITFRYFLVSLFFSSILLGFWPCTNGVSTGFNHLPIVVKVLSLLDLPKGHH